MHSSISIDYKYNHTLGYTIILPFVTFDDAIANDKKGFKISIHIHPLNYLGLEK